MSTQKAPGVAARIGALSIKQLEDLFLLLLNDCKSPKQICKIHAHIIKSALEQSNYLGTNMIKMCSNFRVADYASMIFHDITEPNVFVYNEMIRACSYDNKHELGISLFKQMTEHQRACPNRFTYPFVIKCCGGIQGHGLGKQCHGCVCKVGLISNLTTGNALLDMYGKCDNLDDAHKIFDEMHERNIVSWNCLISGYGRRGQMKRALELGKWIHFYCEKNGLVKKTNVSNALIEMFCRCGCIDEARQVFVQMPERDVISLSTMIAGLANHGKGNEAIYLFKDMKTTTIKPNGITFVAVLSACTHSGFIEQGLQYLESMKIEYNIEPSIHHYSCLVDLLGRGGQLNRALKIIDQMPMKPDAKIWGSLLSSCKTYRNLNIAEIAMERLQEFEPDDTGNYVILSNIYADLGQWDGVSRIRKIMRSKRLKKIPRSSWIEVDSVAREFVSGDDSKCLTGDMLWVLRILQLHLNKKNHRGEILSEDNMELF